MSGTHSDTNEFSIPTSLMRRKFLFGAPAAALAVNRVGEVSALAQEDSSGPDECVGLSKFSRQIVGEVNSSTCEPCECNLPGSGGGPPPFRWTFDFKGQLFLNEWKRGDGTMDTCDQSTQFIPNGAVVSGSLAFHFRSEKCHGANQPAVLEGCHTGNLTIYAESDARDVVVMDGKMIGTQGVDPDREKEKRCCLRSRLTKFSGTLDARGQDRLSQLSLCCSYSDVLLLKSEDPCSRLPRDIHIKLDGFLTRTCP